MQNYLAFFIKKGSQHIISHNYVVESLFYCRDATNALRKILY